MKKKIKARKLIKKNIKLKNKKIISNKIVLKRIRYKKLDSHITKQSILITKNGKLNKRNISEAAKYLQTNETTVEILTKKLHDKIKDRVNVGELSYELNPGNHVLYFYQNMDVDPQEVADLAGVTVEYVLNPNNYTWDKGVQGYGKIGNLILPGGHYVTFDWQYGGGTIINVH